MRNVLCLLVLGLAISSASAETLTTTEQTNYRNQALDGEKVVFGWCQQVNQIAEGWEYWIDFYTDGGNNDGVGYWIGGFDTSGVQNFADYPYVRDVWSYEDWGTNALVAMPVSVHELADYGTDRYSVYRTATHDGTAYGGPPDGLVHADRMWIPNWSGATGGMDPGILMTWRLVFDQQYFDDDLWVKVWYWENTLKVFNMPIDVGTPGDFDGDGDVDADDIDILCDNMGGDPAIYDVDEDGDVDEDDLTVLIETLVQWDNGVDNGIGTKSGDFNLDGLVNATDLAIMKGTFGDSGVAYADGKANCDDVVNATDLAILKNNFGFTAPTGAVPEPMTLLVMAAAGLPLLLKRKRKSRA